MVSTALWVIPVEPVQTYEWYYYHRAVWIQLNSYFVVWSVVTCRLWRQTQACLLLALYCWCHFLSTICGGNSTHSVDTLLVPSPCLSSATSTTSPSVGLCKSFWGNTGSDLAMWVAIFDNPYLISLGVCLDRASSPPPPPGGGGGGEKKKKRKKEKKKEKKKYKK